MTGSPFFWFVGGALFAANLSFALASKKNASRRLHFITATLVLLSTVFSVLVKP